MELSTQPAEARHSRKKAFRGNRISLSADIVINIIFILFSAACLIPVLLVFSISLTSQNSITSNGYQLIPGEINFDAYTYLFKDWASIVRAYGVSIFITISGTLASLLLMGLYAYPLSRRDYPLRGILTFILFFTMLFNGGIVTKYIIYTKYMGIKDSYWSLILPLLIIPFNVIIMRTFFQNSIHPTIVESAKIDGAGELRIFFQIVFPLSLPVFATMGLFSTLNYWNDWFNAMLFITEEKMFPLQYVMMKVIVNIQFIRDNLSRSQLPPDVLVNLPGDSMRMAMAIIGMGPIVLAYPFFQKYFVKGLTLGAVKG